MGGRPPRLGDSPDGRTVQRSARAPSFGPREEYARLSSFGPKEEYARASSFGPKEEYARRSTRAPRIIFVIVILKTYRV